MYDTGVNYNGTVILFDGDRNEQYIPSCNEWVPFEPCPTNVTAATVVNDSIYTVRKYFGCQVDMFDGISWNRIVMPIPSKFDVNGTRMIAAKGIVMFLPSGAECNELNSFAYNTNEQKQIPLPVRLPYTFFYRTITSF